jgi:hypothetical protein
LPVVTCWRWWLHWRVQASFPGLLMMNQYEMTTLAEESDGLLKWQELKWLNQKWLEQKWLELKWLQGTR